MNKEELLTIKEAAERLKVHRVTLYEWMRSGQLRYVLVGQRRRIPESAIAEFIRTAEPQQEAKQPS